MTQQQTTFARAIAEGKDREQAYLTAYPAAHDMRPETLREKADRLAESPAIVAAVERMRTDPANIGDGGPMDGEEAATILTATARRIHAEGGRPADLVRCLSLLARLSGWTDYQPDEMDPCDLTDEERADMTRRQLYGEDGADMTADEVRRESLQLADEVRRRKRARKRA